MRMALDVDVEVESPQELNHSSYLLAGLFDLEHDGAIAEVRIAPSLNQHRGDLRVGSDGQVSSTMARPRKVSHLFIRTARSRLRLAIDFRDDASVFPENALRNSDVVFKRSFDPHIVALIARRSRARILPAGLSFYVHSPYERGVLALKANFAITAMLDATRIDRGVCHRLRSGWRSVRTELDHASERQPLTSEIKPIPPDASRSIVLFQTRTFNRTDYADVNVIHAQRAELIRALRLEFGPQFVGGFVPDPLSRESFPDCLSSLPGTRASYYDAMRRAAVVVYSRGLTNSIAWKFSEYLGLGRCIVAEGIQGTLPAPLTRGMQYEGFDSASECIAKCRELLSDPERRFAMERSARAYYEQWVDPAAGVYRMITSALSGAAAPMPPIKP